MHDSNPIPLDYSREERYRVHKNGHIRVECNEYSVSPGRVGEQVIVKFYANELIIYDLYFREITRHERSFDKDKKYTHWIDFITTIAKRPRALKYSGFYTLLPETWQTYTASLGKEDLREALAFLKQCLLEKDLEFAEQVIHENLRQKVTEPSALWTTYRRMLENRTLYLPEMTVKESYPMPDYECGLEDYDELIRGMHR